MILGPDGKPYETTTPARSEQSARLGNLHREIAEHPTRGLTPKKLARLYIEAEQGNLRAQADLGEDMLEKNTHIYSEYNKRVLAVSRTDFDIQPPDEPTPIEEEATKVVQDILADHDCQDLIQDMCSGILHGYSPIEYSWKRSDGWEVPDKLELRPHNWFMVKRDNQNQLLLRNNQGGEPLNPINWTMHTHKAKSGYMTRANLIRVLGWPYLFLSLSARDLAEFLEILGIPMRLGKYPATATDKEKATLMRAVVGIGHAAAGIIPEGMSIEFMDAAEGGSDPFMAMIKWAEDGISKAILGGTLTTTAANTGLGSNQSDVQNEVRKEIKQNDLRQLKRTLETQLIAQIHALNIPTGRPPKWVWQDEEPEDLKTFGEAIGGYADRGVAVPVNWVRERTGIPEPENGEQVLQAITQSNPTAALSQAINNGLQPVGPQGQLIRNPVQHHSQQLADDASAPLLVWLNQIREMVKQGSSLEQVRDSVLSAYSDLDAEQMRSVMALAFQAAESVGRADVLDEAELTG